MSDGEAHTDEVPSNVELYRFIKDVRKDSEEQWRHIQELREEVTVTRTTLEEFRVIMNTHRAEAKEDKKEVIDNIDSLRGLIQENTVRQASKFGRLEGITDFSKWIIATLIAIGAGLAGWYTIVKGWLADYFRSNGG